MERLSVAEELKGNNRTEHLRMAESWLAGAANRTFLVTEALKSDPTFESTAERL